MTRPWHWAAVVGLLLLAVGLRWDEARHLPLEWDELWSLMLSTGRGSVHLNTPEGMLLPDVPATTQMAGAPGWWRVPLTLRDATHPPLYYTLLGLWRAVVGGSDLAARLLSLALSLGTLGLFWDVLRRWLSPAAAFWGCLILVLGRPGLTLAVQIRPYALELFAGALALQALVRRSSIQLAVGTFLLVATHYFAAGAVLGLLAAAGGCLRGPDRRRAVISIVAPCLLFGLLWSPFLYGQFAAGRFSTADENTLFLNRIDPTLWQVLDLLARVPARVLHVPRESMAVVDYALASLWLMPALLWWRLPVIRPLVLVGCGAVAVPLALDLFRGTAHLHEVRYVLLSSLMFAGLLAAIPAALAGSSRSTRLLASAVPAAVCLLALMSLPRSNSDISAGYPARMEAFESRARPGEPVVFAGREFPAMIPRSLMLEYSHFRTDRSPRPMLLARTPVAAKTLAALDAAIPPDGTAWAITPAPEVLPEILAGRRSARWVNLVEHGFVCQLAPAPGDGTGPATPTPEGVSPASAPTSRISSQAP